MNEEMIVYVDSVGRKFLAVKVSDDDTTLTVKNPVIINAMPNQEGQMSLQLIPEFFREILEDQNQEIVFTYPKDMIVETNITKLAKQIEAQYLTLFKPVPTVIDNGATEGVVVDLFEEKAGE
jgi:hypothetical protein